MNIDQHVLSIKMLYYLCYKISVDLVFHCDVPFLSEYALRLLP